MKKMTLKDKLLTSSKIFFFYAAAYGFTNHFDFLPSTPAPRVDFDQFFSFSPQWIWIYLSEILFLPLGLFFLKDEEQMKSFASSFILLTIVTNLIFLLHPTHIERELFPNPGAPNSLLYYAYDLLRTIDSPKNCFPSLHVATSFLMSFYLGLSHKRIGQLAFYYSILVALSTLYTKQHRIMDGFSGFLLALMCFAFIEKMVPRITEQFKKLTEPGPHP